MAVHVMNIPSPHASKDVTDLYNVYSGLSPAITSLFVSGLYLLMIKLPVCHCDHTVGGAFIPPPGSSPVTANLSTQSFLAVRINPQFSVGIYTLLIPRDILG